MDDFSIRGRCAINTNRDADTFVGVECNSGEYNIHFPLGFHLSENDKDIRRDILLLMNTIRCTTKKKESEIDGKGYKYDYVEFPFQAYLSVIYDFYERGYYREREVMYVQSKRGKIDWNRTIKTQKATFQEGEAFYLDFITKKNTINENELISLVHEYLVYDSFRKIGWLFTDKLPQVPRIKYNYKLFKTTIIEKLCHTYNDKNKNLFKSLLAIIEYCGDENTSPDYKYGTYRFEYVWEQMIDNVFGIKNKEEYFPSTKWRLNTEYENVCLEPDTIMTINNKIYILDAKYYKYGQTKFPSDLPGSASINKQITYGEYVAENDKISKMHGVNRKVYNAFVMPFDSMSDMWKDSKSCISIGDAISDWKSGDNIYEHIQGILLDIKGLMQMNSNDDEDYKLMMAKCIEISAICNYT